MEGSHHPPSLLEGCGDLGTGQGSRERIVADGDHLLSIVNIQLERERRMRGKQEIHLAVQSVTPNH